MARNKGKEEIVGKEAKEEVKEATNAIGEKYVDEALVPKKQE